MERPCVVLFVIAVPFEMGGSDQGKVPLEFTTAFPDNVSLINHQMVHLDGVLRGLSDRSVGLS